MHQWNQGLNKTCTLTEKSLIAAISADVCLCAAALPTTGTNAFSILDNNDATQDEVDASVVALRAGITGLVQSHENGGNNDPWNNSVNQHLVDNSEMKQKEATSAQSSPALSSETRSNILITIVVVLLLSAPGIMAYCSNRHQEV